LGASLLGIDVHSYPGVSANQRGWGSGWPNCQTSKMVELDYPSFSATAQVRGELRALMHLLLLETEVGLDYTLDGQTLDDWAFVCRDIHNPDGSSTGVPSLHSWGLALDLNSTTNVYGSDHWSMPQRVVDLWNRYGFRWGGDYPHTKDPMHYEFMGTPAQAAALTAIAKQELGDDNMSDYADGQADFVLHPGRPYPLPVGWSVEKKNGYKNARGIANLAPKGDKGDPGLPGKDGKDGKTAALTPGTKLTLPDGTLLTVG
jgi:hypothetical protein